MKVLVLTNHLSSFGGSEIVAVEVAMAFRIEGFDVSIYASFIGEPLASYMDQQGLHYGHVDQAPDPKDFDIVWSQHQVLPILLEKYRTENLPRTYLVVASLSPFEPLEMPGALAEIADSVFVNSRETYLRMCELGVASQKLTVFYNASPQEFERRKHHPARLGKLLIISNHMPTEVSELLIGLQERSVQVDHIGLPENPTRVTADNLASYDAVLTIGKSVQYAILGETPVYVYDRFGGPGWLSEANFDDAEAHNFSGRCCRRKLSAAEIAEELVAGYDDAAKFSSILKDQVAGKYLLPKFVRSIAENAANRDQRHAEPAYIWTIIRREGVLANALKGLYLENQNLSHLLGQTNASIVTITETLDQTLAEKGQVQVSLKQCQEEVFRISGETAAQALMYRRAIEERDKTIASVVSEADSIRRSTSWRITAPIRLAVSKIRTLFS